MNIGVVCSRLGGGGGMERLTLDLITGLTERNAAPHVIARKVDSLPICSALPGIHRISTWFVPGKLCDRYVSWRADSLRRSLQLDVIIGCYRMNHPDIVCVGGTHPGFLAAMRRTPRWADRLHCATERESMQYARAIVAHSHMMRDECVKYFGADPEKITVLYPMVDSARFAPVDAATRAALRRERGMEEGKYYFLFPSGDHVRKGLPFIRTIFEQSQLPIELLVAGRGAQAGRNVRPVGYLHDIENWYRAADATVLASIYEPFGMVGVESVFCGTPAICTANMGCCEAVDEPAMLKPPPDDAAAFAAAVEQIVRQPRPAPEALRACVTADLSRAYHAGAILDLCKKIVEERRTGDNA